MKKRVLITGASGFIGYHLILAALQADLEVYAAVRKNSNVQHLKNLNIRYTNLDYSSVDRLEDDIKNNAYNFIIHASGTTKAKTQAEYNNINAQYTLNLGQATRTSGVPVEKFIFLSSLAALGPARILGEQLQDNSTANPVTSYGASKLLAEQYLANIPELPLIVVRPTAVYGPREKDLFILFKTINKGFEPHIGSFQQQLSFIYVTDLAQIVLRALQSPHVGKSYNVSDGNIYSRYALAEGVKKALNKKTLKVHLPVTAVSTLAATMDLLYSGSKTTPALNREKMQELTAINWACNIEKLKQDMNYCPQYNLEKGIMETVNWYKNNHWL